MNGLQKARNKFLQELRELCGKHEATIHHESWSTDDITLLEGPRNAEGFRWTVDVDETLLDLDEEEI